MKILGKDDGVSEVLGYILILGMVVTALALVMLYVFPSIQDTKNSGQQKEIEQGFTVVDSRLSKARFSTSIFQEAPFKLDNGVVSVDDSYTNSHIIVTEQDENGGPVTTLYGDMATGEGTLGTLKVDTNNGEIAYQDGGVWLNYPNGDTVMLSPPDFDYNGVTLTLPVMHIERDTSMQVSGTSISSGRDSTMLIDVKPDANGVIVKYPNNNNLNPIDTGKVITVSVTSDYYKGWYSYFKELGLNPNPPDDQTKTVTVPLRSGHGRQQMPIDNDFDTKYMKPGVTNPINIFEFTIASQGNGNSYTAQYSTDKQQYPWLEIDIGGSTAQMNQEYAEVIFTYHYGPSNNDKEEFQGWVPFQRKSNTMFTVDLLNQYFSNTPNLDPTTGLPLGVMLYTAPSDSTTWNPVVHANDPTAYKSMFDVAQHYITLMHQNYPNGPVYDHKTTYLVAPSQFIFEYASDEQIKYLYITEAGLYTGISKKGS